MGKVPITATSTVSSVVATVSSAFDSATGAAITDRTNSTSVRIENTGSWDVEFRIDDGPWTLLPYEADSLQFINLGDVTIYTRKTRHAAGNGQVTLRIEQVNRVFSAGDTPITLGAALPTLKEELRTMGNAVCSTLPERVAAWRGSAFIYIDPESEGTDAGTLENPYTSWASAAAAVAAAAAGTEILFAIGTTTTMASGVGVPAGSSATAPIVFGVYDPASGARLSGCGTGLATIDATGSTLALAIAQDWVCIDGLEIYGTTTIGAIRINGTVANIQILNCYLHDNATAGINLASATGISGLVIEGNEIEGNSYEGIRYILAADDTTTRISYNYIHGNAQAGNIWIVDASNTFKFSGTIVGNVVENHAGVGVGISNGGGAPLIAHNVCRTNKIGIYVITAAAAAADFSGMIIEANDCEDSGNFGIEVSAVEGVTAPWVIRYNRCLRSGSVDGGTTAGPTNYGRGIETYGATADKGCSEGRIYGNYCAAAYNFINNVSEGCGIALDNNTTHTHVYGNVCEDNEGNSIQVNQASQNAIYSNICIIGNLNYRARTQPSTNNESEIFISAGRWCMVFNNTLVSTRRANQKFGISEYLGADNTKTVYINNLIMGATVAGIERNITGTGATEGNNLIENCPLAVVDDELAEATAAVGTTLVAFGASGVEMQSCYVPTIGGPADATGLASVTAGSAVSFDGRPLNSITPIGARFPS